MSQYVDIGLFSYGCNGADSLTENIAEVKVCLISYASV